MSQIYYFCSWFLCLRKFDNKNQVAFPYIYFYLFLRFLFLFFMRLIGYPFDFEVGNPIFNKNNIHYILNMYFEAWKIFMHLFVSHCVWTIWKVKRNKYWNGERMHMCIILHQPQPQPPHTHTRTPNRASCQGSPSRNLFNCKSATSQNKLWEWKIPHSWDAASMGSASPEFSVLSPFLPAKIIMLRPR